MKLYSIASGSSGNCTLVGSDTTNLLVDAGISKKRIEEGLEQIGTDPASIGGILITHEHSDHVRGLGVMARQYHIPIYATGKTIDALRGSGSLGCIDQDLFCPIHQDESFTIGDIRVCPTAISHDAAEPVAYQFRSEGKRVGVLTDLGTYDDYIIDSFQKMDAILLEANHDVRMLQAGSYPYYLKLRILGAYGHLSNDASGELLGSLLHGGLQTVMLGHLSQENNLKELAFETVRQRVEQTAEEQGLTPPQIQVAHRDRPSRVVEL